MASNSGFRIPPAKDAEEQNKPEAPAATIPLAEHEAGMKLLSDKLLAAVDRFDEILSEIIVEFSTKPQDEIQNLVDDADTEGLISLLRTTMEELQPDTPAAAATSANVEPASIPEALATQLKSLHLNNLQKLVDFTRRQYQLAGNPHQSRWWLSFLNLCEVTPNFDYEVRKDK